MVLLSFIAFVSLGLPDTVLGVAWPSMRATFHRPLSHFGVLLSAGMAGYLVSSFLGGQIVRTIGAGCLLLLSSLAVAAALAGFSLAPAWAATVACAALGGLGAGAIDAGINTFAAARFSPRVVNWLHACWGLGATTGPLLMTVVLARGHSWRAGYAILSGALAMLSVLFLFTRRLWTVAPAADDGGHVGTASILEALRRPIVWGQLCLFFLYCGIESTAGQLLYSLFTESRGMAHTTAGVATGGYWAMLTAGRVVFGQLSAAASPAVVLRIALALAPVAAGLIAANFSTAASLAGAALLGFALAPVFPTLISLTPKRVGTYYAPQAVGFEVAAGNLGIAAVPGAIGVLARGQGLEVVGPCLVAGAVLLLVFQEAMAHVTSSRDTHLAPAH